METTPDANLAKLVKEELLPVYLAYHREHTIETPREVLDYMAKTGIYRPPQVAALLKPKIS